MKRSRGMSSITSIIKSSLRHMTLSLRRFKKRGGIGGFFGRLLLNLKKGRRSTVMGCAAFGLALVLLVCLPLIGGGRKEKALPTPVTEASAASAEGIVDLQGEFAALQLSLAAAEPTPAPTPVPIRLEEGYDGEEIYDIQERLMELSYMDNDEPTYHFGPATEEAIELFQRRHDLTIDGIITNAVYDLLFSDEALKYMVCVGISGTDVRELQGRLRELGYMDKATGNFGEETEAAVKEFQKNNKLTTDGKVGEHT
ncbi:MAG: peptidoglycan-binding protein, partial [Clostridia bacterium]|nr:peptidoglycan-binding protein [Clostridia bacterium]